MDRPGSLEKANPSLGITVGIDKVRAACESAMQNPGEENAFRQLRLNQWVAHGGHPVLRWNMDNVFVRTDPAGNIKMDKEKSAEKIDGAVATVMALDRAIRFGSEPDDSIYNHRGILFI